jgi:hypothetical protein
MRLNFVSVGIILLLALTTGGSAQQIEPNREKSNADTRTQAGGQTIEPGVDSLFNVSSDLPAPPNNKLAANIGMVLAQGAVSVKLFGAKGDGTTDDTVAIGHAMKYIFGDPANRRGLYFPCGTYIVTSMISTVGWGGDRNGPNIIGENQGCTFLRYSGTSVAEAVLKIWAGAASTYIYNFTISNITVLGNANVTYDIEILAPTQFSMTNVRMWGANATIGACLYINSAVNGTIITPTCNLNSHDQSASLPVPANGIILDGAGVLQAGVPLVIISPTVDYVTGKALWIKNEGLTQISGCQITATGIALYMEDSAQNNQINACLFEGQKGQKGNNRIAGTSNSIANSSFTSTGSFGTDIYGIGNVLQNVYAASRSGGRPLSIKSEASYTSLYDLKLGGAMFINDQGTGTRIINQKSDNNTFALIQDTANVPINRAFRWNGTVNNTKDSTTVMSAAYSFGNSPTVLTSTLYTTGKSWRAIFIGEWQDYAASVSTQAVPPYVELTETKNTITLPTGATITFSVNGSGQFQGVTGASCCQVFQGTITFIPNLTPISSSAASGPNSMSLSGGIKAASLSTTQIPTASTTASDYSVPIVLNGVTYYIRLSTTP